MHSRPLVRRALAAAVGVFMLLALGPAGPAAADSLVRQAHRDLRRIHRVLGEVRERQVAAERHLLRRIQRAKGSRLRAGSGHTAGFAKRRLVHRRIADDISRSNRRLRNVARRNTRRLRALIERQAELRDWLSRWEIFHICPVDPPYAVADNYGILVDLPGVPVHIHRGNDIAAPTGTPIRAPFDGYAWSGSSVLGGLEVRVRGDLGYVFNAHLLAVGKLGDVKTGDIVGYVGSGGDATVPHDHLEWHPGDGPAVDPNPYLSAVC